MQAENDSVVWKIWKNSHRLHLDGRDKHLQYGMILPLCSVPPSRWASIDVCGQPGHHLCTAIHESYPTSNNNKNQNLLLFLEWTDRCLPHVYSRQS
jgi:hypothetical protein